MRDLYIAAERAVLSGKSWNVLGQSVTYEDLDKIRKGRQEWEEILNTLQGGGGRRIGQISWRVW